MIQRAWKIYQDNASTFYDYRTNRKQNQWRKKAAIVALATVGATLTPVQSLEVLSATITVQAILIGFSFSVMFFLVQDAAISRTTTSTSPADRSRVEGELSLEAQLDEEQVRLLSKELFWNISYFNLVAFASLVFALMLMLPNVWANIGDSFDGPPAPVAAYFRDLAAVSSFAAQWSFALLMLESGYTFVRTVGRVNFLFEQRMGRQA